MDRPSAVTLSAGASFLGDAVMNLGPDKWIAENNSLPQPIPSHIFLTKLGIGEVSPILEGSKQL